MHQVKTRHSQDVIITKNQNHPYFLSDKKATCK